ncbi:calcium-dependent cysteine-type endopeptidase [Aureococcus anophagefferens]|nr:calcium-dependent cysteine-type endopeptidase [Aureococcus anophagefferens]
MIDLTVSSDEDDDVEIVDVVPKRPREDDDAPRAQPREDDEDEPRKKPREDDGAEEPRKKPRAAAPPLAGRRTRVDRDDDAAPAADAARCAALAGAREPYVDDAFPAAAASLVGEADEAPAPAPAAHPFCACKALAVTDVVKSTTPNDGRSYWRCATRRCGFFAWAGDGPRKRSQLAWARLDGTVAVVTDYGFSANDLAQGGLGDCWFLSALSLPVTSKPRRENTAAPRAVTAGGLSLAYVRSRCATTGATTLWAPLLEKAYAKAHGSFKSISGGQIAEALLDLTGAPTFCVDFARNFDSERLWRSLERWRARRFPMGCATDPQPDLREWADVVSSSRGNERTGVNDGTFWIDFTHFLMGFSRVDVCVAAEKPRAASFRNAFPAKKEPWRVARKIYDVVFEGDTDLFVTALQPTQRGTFCRGDRKVSYRPGDLQLVAVDETGRVVAACFRGADCFDRGATFCKGARGARLRVYVYALGANPDAAGAKKERTAEAPFHVRFYAPDAAFEVTEADFDAAAHGASALAALHGALRWRRPAAVASELEPYFSQAEPARADVATGAAGAHISAIFHSLRLIFGRAIISRNGDGIVAVTVANRAAAPKRVAITLYAKSAAARDGSGVLANDKAAADAYYARRRALVPPGAPRPRSGFRYPAKWAAFAATADLAPGATRLAATVVRKGVQYELGDVLCEVSDAGAGAKKQTTPTASGGGARTSRSRASSRRWPTAAPPRRRANRGKDIERAREARLRRFG